LVGWIITGREGAVVAAGLSAIGTGFCKHVGEAQKRAVNSVGNSVVNKESQAIISGNSESFQPYLGFKQVSISFGSNVVLDRVSFTAMSGETLCIMGRSGVGKSVCLRILMGFLKPDSGRVIVAGEDITDFSEEQLDRIRKKVTMVFQSGALFDSLSVGENVAFALRERGELSEMQINERVASLLGMVGIGEIRNQFPADISTGMRRSVAIARALAENPKAVLYDEPTTMVDPLMTRRLGNLIARFKAQLKLTSIVVTHDTRLAERLADQVLFLDQGKILFFGTAGEMERSSEPLVKEFLKDDQLGLHLFNE
jgi:phospholipid/cholesterol/gamma-HCH transport system ATP-binding protein